MRKVSRDEKQQIRRTHKHTGHLVANLQKSGIINLIFFSEVRNIKWTTIIGSKNSQIYYRLNMLTC